MNTWDPAASRGTYPDTKHPRQEIRPPRIERLWTLHAASLRIGIRPKTLRRVLHRLELPRRYGRASSHPRLHRLLTDSDMEAVARHLVTQTIGVWPIRPLRP
jgi:hypothetical protein